ncbi:MAG: flippase, partial [Anaerolineae bacterium]|nr:flippase [Anaerolineae bacterium]
MSQRRVRPFLPELGICLLLLLLPLLLFAPVALGNRTLLPVDALFLFQPYRAAASALGVEFPHNHLVSDLILENYAWKRFIVEAISRRELPLWDPYLFAGHPFLANGQHSALYPLSLLFYILPLWRAYGVFAWLQLGLAGIFAYLFARVLGMGRLGGLIGGITFQFSGFMAISSVPHPMIVAGASWLPFILAMAELVIRQQPALGRHPATLPWALLGAAGIGCQILAGHGENTYFVVLVAGAYIVWRLAGGLVRRCLEERGCRRGAIVGWLKEVRRPVLWLALMAFLGLALGAVQLIPYLEVVAGSFRSGEAAATLEQVLGWAYPPRHLIAFAIPNFFGGPTQHEYFDLFLWRWVPAPVFADGQYLDWGIKNYVEGAAYLGLLPWLLTVAAVATVRRNRRMAGRVAFFIALALFSLGCIFGTPLYALIYALPGLEQSHSPFRWVFPLSLAVAMLAGFGAEAVQIGGLSAPESARKVRRAFVRLWLLDGSPSLVTWLGGLSFWGGAAVLVALLLSRLFFTTIEPLIEQVFLSLAKAPEAFPDHRAFYSYEFRWTALFGLLLMGSGIVLRVSCCPIFILRRPVWEWLAPAFLVLDLLSFAGGFGPAVDPALLDHLPPVVTFLRQDGSLWRYASFTPPGTTKTMNANVGMFYDLQCVAGYDSLFSRQYADYMKLIEPQDELQYNRIASFREWSSLDSPLTDLLNVKYIITEVEIPNPKYRLVYRDEAVYLYENLGVMPRAYTLPKLAALLTDDFGRTVQSHDPRNYVILDAVDAPRELRFVSASYPATATPQRVTRYTLNEVEVEAEVDVASWLVLADAFFPGWKAFVRPLGAGEEAWQQVALYRVNGIFRGVLLKEPGAYTIRFKYSPDSVKIGAFITFLGGMVLLFLSGLYLWRFFYREEDEASTVRRVAKNSLAPIVLNLFNRAIDFAFAALMARILGPVGTGRYAWAVSVYLWFDIVANFGLDMYLMREAARERERGREFFLHTTALRVLLFVFVAPALMLFILGWQVLNLPLAAETKWALLLLYLGLLPGSVANGVAALFRACEKHEYPAAIQTVTTIIKVTLGVLALVGGMGIAGVAGASVLTNGATLVCLTVLARKFVWPGLPAHEVRINITWPALRPMLAASWPLMVSLLLQALFPGINVLLLKPYQGDAAVGWYDAGRKWIDAFNIIPAFFTVAVFPVVSRLAADDRAGLLRSYRLAAKLLMIVSLPLAICTTLLATPLVGLLSGREFLPHGAVALRILSWSILGGWINSLTNYVLIALNRQQYVLVASGIRVIFAVAANLLFVGRFSYLASAWILVAGELLLMWLFCSDLHRQLGPVGWGGVLGRPLLPALVMG